MNVNSTPVLISDKKLSLLTPMRLDGSANASFNEDTLQGIIDRHPSCLPVHDIEPGFGELVSICREMPTDHGYIDNLLMTEQGDIVIVEAKLWRNPQARREAVAQALDYAACLFEMGYEDFESAALNGQVSTQQRPQSLFDFFDRPEGFDEVRFVDAVNKNLGKGRILIIVAGDGIRTETEKLVEGLQSHAGFHFTFALVELAAYQVPETDDIFIQPGILAKTVMIERGVVQLDDQRLRVKPPEFPVQKASKALRTTISEEKFFEEIARRGEDIPKKLKDLIEKLESLGVYKEYKGSLNLKWDQPEGNPVNLGYITKRGEVWTTPANWFVPHELSYPYQEKLAEALNCDVEKDAYNDDWHLRKKGKSPRIEEIANDLDKWVEVAAEFIGEVKKYGRENSLRNSRS